MEKTITVLTATYNRANLLPDLYQSLCRQTCQDFDWIIIDDGSIDHTQELIQAWMRQLHSFSIQYIHKENGGKNRAINDGVRLVKTPFAMIVDSDDYLTDDAIEFLSIKANEVLTDNRIAGISGLKGSNAQTPLKEMTDNGQSFIITNNLERKQYGLETDACEVYKTAILRNHPFKVWPCEKFIPEEIIWNQIALEGYTLRWYNKVTYIARYQEEGLTKDSFNLIKKNPMGYAMMYKQRISLSQSFKDKIYNASQMIAYAVIGKQMDFIFKETNLLIILLSLPIGFLLSIRRKIQYNQ